MIVRLVPFEVDGVHYVLRVPNHFSIIAEVECEGQLRLLRLSTDIAEVMALMHALEKDQYGVRTALHVGLSLVNPLISPSGDNQVVLGFDRVSSRPYLKLFA